MYCVTLRNSGFVSHEFGVNKNDSWINYLLRLIHDMNNTQSRVFMIQNSNIALSNITPSQLIEIITLTLSRSHYKSLTKRFGIDKFYSVLTG